MPKVTNLLTEGNYSFVDFANTSEPKWSLIINLGYSAEFASTKIKYPGTNSAKLSPDTNEPIVFSISGIPIPAEYVDLAFRAAIWVSSPDDVIVKVKVTTSTLVGSSFASSSTKVYGAYSNKWTLASVEKTEDRLNIGETATIGMEVTIHDVGNTGVLSADHVYVCSPILASYNYVFTDKTSVEAFRRLPEYMINADVNQSNPTFPLFRFMNVAFVNGSDIGQKWWDFAYFPPNDVEEPKSSALVDANTADFQTLFWLAQILGIQIQNAPTGFTSWSSIQKKIDNSLLGGNEDNTPQWTEWEAVSDWQSIELLQPNTLFFEDELRVQALTGVYGINGGTRGAIKTITKRFLTGNKQVKVENFTGGNPWVFTVKTLVSETPDMKFDGDQSTTISDAIIAALPVGYKASHMAVNSL